jgi:hypothetical protein
MLLLFRKIIIAYSEKYVSHKNTLCGKSVLYASVSQTPGQGPVPGPRLREKHNFSGSGLTKVEIHCCMQLPLFFKELGTHINSVVYQKQGTVSVLFTISTSLAQRMYSIKQIFV